MEMALTKMSKNGQVVIPMEVREDAQITPSTKFIVFNSGGNILLKVVRKEELIKEMRLIERIEQSELQIKEGKYVRANTNMTDEEIDNLLMA